MPTENATTTHAEPVRRDTRQRRAVRDALANIKAFVSAQELHAALRDTGDRIGLATVYRALADLAGDAEADVIQADDGETRYRACDTDAHHHHVICRACGLTVEVQADTVERWLSAVAAEHGFVEAEHTVNIFGLCAQCAVARG